MGVNGDDEGHPENAPSEDPTAKEPSEDHPQGLAGVPSVIAEGVVAALTGIPPQVQRSFYKVIDYVFKAGAQWPASYLKGKARITAARANVEIARLEAEASGIKARQKAKDLITRDGAKAAAAQFADPDKAERAFDFHAAGVLRNQEINEDIVRIAAEEVQKDPPKQDSAIEIDGDWLAAFFREAPLRSTEEYKNLFGRILAGEIKEPGTFSIGTVRSLALLTSDTARIFQLFCNITTNGILDGRIISDPFGHAGGNSLSMFGLEYNNLIRLSESGLVRPSFTEWQELTPLIYDGTIVLDHADIKLFLRRDGSEHSKQLNSNIRLTGPALTSVGTELRRVVTMTHSPEYLKALARWFKARHLDLYRATEQDGERLRGEKIDSL